MSNSKKTIYYDGIRIFQKKEKTSHAGVVLLSRINYLDF